MNSENTVFINMFHYGITTLVGATQDKIDWYMNEYSTQPDKKFGGGAGKKKLMTYTFGGVRFFVCEALRDLSTAAGVACDERPPRWASRCEIVTHPSL
jgi:hypothetical protein